MSWRIQKSTLALIAVLVPLLALFVFVVLRSGPMAPVRVTVEPVAEAALTPALFGIGTVQARHTYKIGPTAAGRLDRVEVQVGDRVRAGQLVAEMAPVDLDERVRAQQAALRRAEAGVRDAQARQDHAARQQARYAALFAQTAVSRENLDARQQELRSADAALAAAQQELARARADGEAAVAQRANLRLLAPVAGIVAQRDADPGTTLVAGQSVVQVVDPADIWVHARFDQIRAQGLAARLPASVVLRSRGADAPLAGQVDRIEPVADAITEEALAKVRFDGTSGAPPPIGELAEVTVRLPTLPAAPVVPSAAVHRRGTEIGVWLDDQGRARFTPVVLGAADLEGRVQVREGLRAGDPVVVHIEAPLSPGKRLQVVDQLMTAAGDAP